jgi:Ca2+-binding RTX toxin-like protein
MRLALDNALSCLRLAAIALPAAGMLLAPIAANAQYVATGGCKVNGVSNQPCEGTPGRDKITGTTGDDVIIGHGGRDRIRGRRGNDIIIAGEGDDFVEGGDGEDLIFGGPGRDRLKGDGEGLDIISAALIPTSVRTATASAS